MGQVRTKLAIRSTEPNRASEGGRGCAAAFGSAAFGVLYPEPSMSGRPIAFGCALALLAVAAVSPRAAQAQRALKVYISVDMEGITGVVSSDQLGPTSFEYQRAREWMTGEALAAIQGARDAGATEIVVSDSHGNGENLLIDQFPDDITIVRSWPRSEGLSSSWAS